MPKDGSFPNSYFSGGSTNTIDDETGQKVKMSDVRKRWDGYRVTGDNWEERQPQDFPRVPRTPKVFKDFRDEPEPISYTPPDKSTLGSDC
ncbi:MAG: hypothetical protein ACPH3C_06305 [Glaciecola sp.]